MVVVVVVVVVVVTNRRSRSFTATQNVLHRPTQQKSTHRHHQRDANTWGAEESVEGDVEGELDVELAG